MANTKNYNLFVTDDDSVGFKEWREAINSESDSNTTKIDDALGGIDKTLSDIKDRLAELEYVPISIIKFSLDKGTNELGSIVAEVKFTWKTNKAPKTLKIGSNDIPIGGKTEGTYTLSGQNINTKTDFTLVADDGKNKTSKSATVNFCNAVYYGVKTLGTSIDNAFVTSLTEKTLQSTRAKTFTVTAGVDQYIWYALPVSYGACKFNVGGFDGGFSLAETISFTNDSGYTENYYIYKSDNANLGTQTVEVS